jgi:hypothetical protein
MVMTILEAPVAPERWRVLRDSYGKRARIRDSDAIIESFLVHDLTVFDVWANPRSAR